ncbi:MAG: PIN domain-containing protein [Candidatus Sulfomarinibacteraceae bacterium]
MSVPTIVDTSVWIDLFRDGSMERRSQLESFVDPEDVVLTPFTELELLQGCRDEQEWALLAAYLETQEYVEPKRSTWASAARIFFDLRRVGKTVRSPIGCCIAQIAIDGKTLLLHRDRDFEVIAEIRPLQQRFLRWES